MKKTLCLLLFFLSFIAGFAQTVLENNPIWISWYQINTPHFRILYPKGFEVQAQRIAATMERMYRAETRSLSGRPIKTSIIMQNRAAQSNAFVSVLPRRAEFFTMPSQNYNFIGNNEWFDLIAAHELRHILQFAHANRGMTRILYYLAGNYGLAAAAAAAVPQWFWEGDAVATETALTTTGRGKIPNFGLILRTNLLEGREFNYHKQLLGSYKHLTPDEYALGYHFVSYLRWKTGDPLVWDRITADAWKWSLVPFTFSNAIRKETGMPITRLYREMAKDLKTLWNLPDTLKQTPARQVNPRNTTAYTDYLYPQVLRDGSVITMKSGIGDIDQVTLISPDGEKKLAVTGLQFETGFLSAGGDRVVWNEFRFHPRWRRTTSVVIVAYDKKTGRMWDVTGPRARHAGAALSPDGTKVVALLSDYNYRHNLAVIDMETGARLHTFDNPDNALYSMFRWSENGALIVSLKTTEEGKSVVTIDPESGDEKEILPPTNRNIGYPLLTERYLLYNAPADGIDEIEVRDLQTGVARRLTRSRYGSYNPELSSDGTQLYFNRQGRDGMDVVSMPFDPEGGVLVDTADDRLDPLAATLVAQESAFLADADTVEGQTYPAQPYSRWSGIFNPYTWGPYIDNSFGQVDLGFTSRDVLSTMQFSAGYRYDISERTGEVHAGMSFQGWYPIISFAVRHGQREDESTIALSADDRRRVAFAWEETGISGGISVPLSLTRSKYLTNLNISNSVGLTMTKDFGSTVTTGTGTVIQGDDRYIPANDTLFFLYRDITDYGRLIFNNFSVSYSHLLRQSRRDFNPKFGQFLGFDSYSTPFGGDYQGWQWTATGTFFFPGLLKHHSLYLAGGYQQAMERSELDVYAFRNRLFKPRGYSYPQNTQFFSISGNYALPLWYPDIAVGPLLNIQRVRLNLFFDYGEGEGQDYYYNFESGNVYTIDTGTTYKSAGAELMFDVNFFRTQPQFEIGIRAVKRESNRFSAGGWQYELLIGNIPL
ncbi:MAG TPA: hypothetical protein VKZ86_13215 [Cyclobacteriaceae bacterium]|nr:hypothetical protein [Cyclobacteriaceae bacterium]